MAVYCEDGRLFRSYVANDGADGAVEIGPCDAWPGCGCQYDIPEQAIVGEATAEEWQEEIEMVAEEWEFDRDEYATETIIASRS